MVIRLSSSTNDLILVILLPTLCLMNITNRRNCLVGQINNVLCYFGKLDTITKIKLLKSYCTSFYGCELWDFWNSRVEDFCKAFRHGQRSVLKLPFDTHRHLLPLLCDSIPVCNEICRRFFLFVHRALVGDCEIVKFVIKFSILFGGMNSFCGRNMLFCSSEFNLYVNDIFSYNFCPAKELFYEYCNESDVYC